MMKVVISPAKSLDFESQVPTEDYSTCSFLDKSEKINNTLKKQSAKKLAQLMSISKDLSELNYQRNQEWHLPFTQENARQAIFAFNGDVYVGLDAYSIPQEKMVDLQNKIRILSGLYGMLKPLDLIQPYRLEMGTKLKIGRKDNLYQYWKEEITKSLNEELEGDPLINLASAEYFKVIDQKKLKSEIITPEFKDFHQGKLKMIGFFAKKARGAMARFVVEKGIDHPQELKTFDWEGYSFDDNLSSANKWVFTR
ncbi:MAG: peroxide stress protein YaaA [Lutimonas sp.]